MSERPQGESPTSSPAEKDSERSDEQKRRRSGGPWSAPLSEIEGRPSGLGQAGDAENGSGIAEHQGGGIDGAVGGGQSGQGGG